MKISIINFPDFPDSDSDDEAMHNEPMKDGSLTVIQPMKDGKMKIQAINSRVINWPDDFFDSDSESDEPMDDEPMDDEPIKDESLEEQEQSVKYEVRVSPDDDGGIRESQDDIPPPEDVWFTQDWAFASKIIETQQEAIYKNSQKGFGDKVRHDQDSVFTSSYAVE